jgi:ribonucleoside-diphosphate reductase alpha chain
MTPSLTHHSPLPTFKVEKRERIKLTPTQRSVIEQRYLKKSSSVESWLNRVAHNIALAELLFEPKFMNQGLLDGVRVQRKEIRSGKLTSKAYLFHANNPSVAERDLNFKRFMDNCEKLMASNKEAFERVRLWQTKFYDLMASWDFLPNSPTLMNAGEDLQQLSACYVLPIEDSMESITHALQAQALIHKSGGGTGFSFGKIRPLGDPVKTTEGTASGVISFIQVFDKMTEVIKQGGNRRGANMGILPYDHPEIREFIRMKSHPGILENFNISIAVDDRFFEAVENGWEYDLINPRTRESEGRVRARDVFDSIVENAWRTGDPGLVFIDEINRSPSNATPALGRIDATNPCGEQPLLANEPCNLGSLNLSHFVNLDDDRPVVLWDKLRNAVMTAVRFLDNVIDMNNYPLAEIEAMAKGNRRIGLGIMGWAEMLAQLGIPYDSQDALKMAEDIMGFISETTQQVSHFLAGERGPFLNWSASIYHQDSPHFRGDHKVLRNCASTTIAPTGTIGLVAGIQGGGIEPFYGIAYTRYNQNALDDIKKGLPPQQGDIFYEVNPLFKQVAQENGFFGLKEKDLWKKIDLNHKSVRGIPEIPESIQRIFPIAHDITVESHVRMQAAFQKHTDNGVSKTINLNQESSLQDVSKAFHMAHDLKCKGITVYRDGSKKQQVLNLVSNPMESQKVRDFTAGVSSDSYEIKTGYGPLHVHIEYDEAGPYRVLTHMEPPGTEVAGLATALGVLVTQFLEKGGDLNQLTKPLQSIKGDRPLGFGPNRIHSISHGLAVALKSHLEKHNWVLDEKSGKKTTAGGQLTQLEAPQTSNNLELWKMAAFSDQCPECFGHNVSTDPGCKGPICHDCGYSECN